jgi:microcystin-dependent protein
MKKIAICFALLNLGSATLWASPNTITFQGTLKQNGVPVNAPQNLQFEFVDGPGPNANQIHGTPIQTLNVPVNNGLFAANLAVDPNFPWDQYSPFIQVSVQLPGGGFTTLQPNQPINANLYSIAGAVPPGTITAYGGQSAPAGWLLCDGSVVSATTYSGLFNAIGTTWGGSGSTFNLPDLRGRAPIGAGQGSSLTNRILGDTTIGEESHTQTLNEMPAHSHSIPPYNNFPGGSGPGGGVDAPAALGGGRPILQTANAGSGAPFNVMQPSAVVNYIIKY